MGGLISNQAGGPRILFLDIESTPLLGYTWGIWEQNVIEVLEDWYMLSFAYRWADSHNVIVRALPDYKGYKKNLKNDRFLIKELHQLLSSCDIAIAHNGDAFDFKKANARFIYHKLKPPPPFRTIDTLKILRKHFKLDSNKLDAACGFLGIGRKLPHTGKHLWFGCMGGDRKSWAKMLRYNAHDVTLLSALFDYIKPWAPNLPNLNLYSGGHGCPSCQSNNVQRRGITVARSRRYRRFQCRSCGSWFSGAACKDNRAA